MNILFLDDDPVRGNHFISAFPYARWVKTAAECISQLQREDKWDLVCLDHDLGGQVYVDSGREDCGMEVARWLYNNQPKNIKVIYVHTLNTPAGQRMSELLSQVYETCLCPFYLLVDTLKQDLERFDEQSEQLGGEAWRA